MNENPRVFPPEIRMLNAGAVALVVTLISLPVLLAASTLRSGWSWPVRLAAGGAVALFAAVIGVSAPGLLGWPAGAEPPARFRLLAVHVQQPDKQTRDAGSVFLWAIDARDMTRATEPRAYRLPYSAALHETAAGAGAKLGKGIAQLGEFSGALPTGAGPEQPAADRQAAMNLKFYDVPDPLFPEG